MSDVETNQETRTRTDESDSSTDDSASNYIVVQIVPKDAPRSLNLQGSDRVKPGAGVNIEQAVINKRAQAMRKQRARRRDIENVPIHEGSNKKGNFSKCNVHEPSPIDGLKMFANSQIRDLKAKCQNMLAQLRKETRKSKAVQSSTSAPRIQSGCLRMKNNTQYFNDASMQRLTISSRKGGPFHASQSTVSNERAKAGARSLNFNDGSSERLMMQRRMAGFNKSYNLGNQIKHVQAIQNSGLNDGDSWKLSEKAFLERRMIETSLRESIQPRVGGHLIDQAWRKSIQPGVAGNDTGIDGYGQQAPPMSIMASGNPTALNQWRGKSKTSNTPNQT